MDNKMDNLIHVNLLGVGQIQVAANSTLFELSQREAAHFRRPVLIAKMDNELQGLSRPILHDCDVEFLDITDTNGFRTYQRGVSFVMIYAIKAILGKKTRVSICHSINKNYFCELPDNENDVTVELLQKIEHFMRDVVDRNITIEKHELRKSTAIKIAEELGLNDKVSLLRYRHSPNVSFYKLDWMYNYFYGEMPPNTGQLGQFKLIKSPRGFMLQFPDAGQNFELSDNLPDNAKLSKVFAESKQWMRIMKADTVGALNDKLCQTGSGEIIRVAEALQEKRVAALADTIVQNHRSIVLIAGPSSSGKTTFAARLSVQLRVNGAIPHVISLDNYYLNREHCPRDADGNYDFETINAIDTAQITKT